jgi:VWFA-related protein
MILMRLRSELSVRSAVLAVFGTLWVLAGIALAAPAAAQTAEARTPETQSRETQSRETQPRETQPRETLQGEARSEGAPAAGVPTFEDVLAVRVVNVDVFVTDRSGDHFSGLTREDFELRVDGNPMPISNFYHELRRPDREATSTVERPRTASASSEFTPMETAQRTADRRNHVVVLIDHTRLATANRERAFKALREALVQLDPEDMIAVVGVQESLVFYSDFLFDRRAVEQILDRASGVSMRSNVAEVERRQILDEMTRGQSGGILARSTLADEDHLIARIRGYAASEYERSVGSFRQIQHVLSTLNGVPGRKILLYVGEGIPTRPGEELYTEWIHRFGGPELGMRHYDFNSDYTQSVGRYDLTDQMEQIADTAHRANVILYAVDAEDNHGMALRSALTEQGASSDSVSLVDENFRAPLEYTTQATGGRLLRASGQLSEQMADLFTDFNNAYSLGFVMPDEWEPGSAHRIEVKVRRFDGLRLRHREAVVVPAPDEREAGATVAALLYQTLDNSLGIQAEPQSPTRRDDGVAVLPVQLEIPVDSLELVPRGASHAVSLSIYVSVKDKDGNPRQVQKVPFHLEIPSDKVEEARGELAYYTLPVVLRPGDQQVAITVRDDADRELSTVRLDVAELARDI